MFVWLIPNGYDLASTVGIVALNFIVGGLIGGVILIWRLLCAGWYLILTVFRLFTLNKSSSVKIKFEEKSQINGAWQPIIGNHAPLFAGSIWHFCHAVERRF